MTRLTPTSARIPVRASGSVRGRDRPGREWAAARLRHSAAGHRPSRPSLRDDSTRGEVARWDLGEFLGTLMTAARGARLSAGAPAGVTGVDGRRSRPLCATPGAPWIAENVAESAAFVRAGLECCLDRRHSSEQDDDRSLLDSSARELAAAAALQRQQQSKPTRKTTKPKAPSASRGEANAFSQGLRWQGGD